MGDMHGFFVRFGLLSAKGLEWGLGGCHKLLLGGSRLGAVGHLKAALELDPVVHQLRGKVRSDTSCGGRI